MTGNQQIIEALNQRLLEEFTAIQQYSAHRAIMSNWGYAGFVSYIQERIDDETKHFNTLLDRILFLGGLPADGINQANVGQMIDAMLANDHASELDAIGKYNATIALCVEHGDDDTRRLLEAILADETDHIHDIEINLTQLAQMGAQNYLANQTGGGR